MYHDYCLFVKPIDNFQIDEILVFGAYGGRIDQVFSNIDVLYQARSKYKNCTPIYLVETSQVACLLPVVSFIFFFLEKY